MIIVLVVVDGVSLRMIIIVIIVVILEWVVLARRRELEGVVGRLGEGAAGCVIIVDIDIVVIVVIVIIIWNDIAVLLIPCRHLFWGHRGQCGAILSTIGIVIVIVVTMLLCWALGSTAR